MSVGKLKNNRKSALIKPMAQNFRVFRVNGKDPKTVEMIMVLVITISFPEDDESDFSRGQKIFFTDAKANYIM